VAGVLFDRAGVPSPYVAGSIITLLALVLSVAWGLTRQPAH